MSLPLGLRQALAAAVGHERLLTDAADCFVYGYDNSRKHHLPDAVVFATTEIEVQMVVRACRQHKTSLVARGRGTGTTGAAVPLRGGIVLSLERMNQIVAVDPANRLMRVEPGTTNQEVQQAASAHGFFWPPDPTSAAYCSVGGNIAVNSAGPRAVKYGTVRENTLGLHAVTGAGDIIRVGVSTTKGAVGYDLTRLLIGSEGTLAIITQATLKLTPLASAKRTLRAVYDTMHHAAEAVSRIMAQPITPCALEFLDGAAIGMVRAYSQALPESAGALLLIEADGPEAAMDEAVAALSHAASGPGLTSLMTANTAAEATALWAVRKALSPALRTLAPNKLNEDVVVPVSRIPELIARLGELSQKFGIPIVNFGHAGNGNIHVNLLYDSQNAEQEAQARPCLSEVFDLVLLLDGTLSGEHGVGLEKRDYVGRAIDAPTLALMRAIKAQFDPDNILNPDKLFPITSS
ncbi:MAG TPA: FAD-linked oxidase C-terminal domain-containing protein [Acidiferrobacter sp.]|nr:FAD-linked oxidase C-terminal domain-containing protein [Acidiferrobacter sp.]